MTDKKFTDEEIKKALECHTKRRCWDNCPNAAEERQRLNRPCSQMIAEDALDLINRKQAEIERAEKERRYWETECKEARADLTQNAHEAIKEFEEKSEKILIELYEKYHKIANKPKKETDMFYLFYQGRAEAIWECITANRNLVKEMTEDHK